MTPHPNHTGGEPGSLATAIYGCRAMKSRRSAHTSSLRVLAMRTMASTWVLERSFTMPLWDITGTGARWKKFLSLVSLTAVPYGSGERAPRLSGVMKSFGGRDLG